MMLAVWLGLALLPAGALAQEQAARWLGNTFRIDPSVQQLTLFIEREAESMPVVLIRPDGSKYYYQRHPDSISWASTATRDVITLWQPEPGPWQATGKIAGEHGITLLSVFRLELDALPEKLYQNEVIRLHGQLRHGNTLVDANYYLDGLRLTAQLLTEADARQDDPFNRAPLLLGEFVDDGTGLDAQPGDGNMTAEVVFEALPGRYLFQAEVSNGVLARYAERNITLYPMPVHARFTTPDTQRRWHLELEVDSNLDADSLTVTGQLINPLEQTLAISGQGRHIELPPARQPGNYRWQGRAYATTADGREIQLQLKPQVIRVVPPLPEVSPAPAAATAGASAWQNWPLWAALGTVVVLIAGGGWWWRRRRRK